MGTDSIDWEMMEKPCTIDALQASVPVVRGKVLDADTAIAVVEHWLKALKVEAEYMDKVSIARQAYKYRAMISHLHRIHRQPRKKRFHVRVMELVRQLGGASPRASGNKNGAKKVKKELLEEGGETPGSSIKKETDSASSDKITKKASLISKRRPPMFNTEDQTYR